MPCFICKGKAEFYQRLDRSRIRFMRKVYHNFEDSSYLCMRCFEKFENIFKSKKKSKQNSSVISVVSNASVRTVSSETGSKSSSDKSVVARRAASSKENTQSNGSPALQFLSHSFSPASDDSIDSTDRLVQMNVEIPSLRDSSKVSRQPDVVVAREGAQAAERSALRRKRTREDASPLQTPTGRRNVILPVIPDDDGNESDIPSNVASDDLALVRPIVKKRKQPVVHLNQDVMDIYLANTSGG